MAKQLENRKNSRNAPKCVEMWSGLCYNAIDNTRGGLPMNISDICRDLIQTSDVKQSEIARRMGWNPPNLSNRLRRNTLSADEFVMFLEAIGYEMKIVKKDTEDEVVARKRGVGPRLQMMVNGVKYDTFKSDAICNSEKDNDMFIELYRDLEGRYFVAHYVMWNGGVSSITPIGEEDANKLIEKYGTK